MLAVKITFIIIISFAIGVFFGAIWTGLFKKDNVKPGKEFDESDIYNPKLKIIKREKTRP